MKVYIVYFIDIFGAEKIAKIFSTEDKAKRYKESMETQFPEDENCFYFEECEVE